MKTVSKHLYRNLSLGILAVVLAALIAAAWLHPLAGGPQSGQRLNVVAGENFWGSLASQLGGNRVNVTSIVSDPNADPHEYESSTANARSFAAANLIILNGAGYDDWGNKLLAANPEAGRQVLTAATLLGKKTGDNPHFWYNPDYVYKMVDQISAEYESIDPAHAGYYRSQHATVEASLNPYRQRLGYIKSHFGGTRVAATEDIFAYLASYTGLNLVSPPEFMQAVAEGNDPPADSVATFNDQLAAGTPKVLVYNLQTSTAVTTNIRKLAAAQNIPVVGVTETTQPPGATFQDWMDGELDALTNALNAPALGQ